MAAREIIHYLQPPGSNLCGQACLAMVAGVSLSEAIEAMGTRGKTHAYQMLEGLDKLRVAHDPFFTRNSGDAYRQETTAILRHRKGDLSHFALWHQGRIFDPEGEPLGWPVVSYVRIDLTGPASSTQADSQEALQ